MEQELYEAIKVKLEEIGRSLHECLGIFQPVPIPHRRPPAKILEFRRPRRSVSTCSVRVYPSASDRPANN